MPIGLLATYLPNGSMPTFPLPPEYGTLRALLHLYTSTTGSFGTNTGIKVTRPSQLRRTSSVTLSQNALSAAGLTLPLTFLLTVHTLVPNLSGSLPSLSYACSYPPVPNNIRLFAKSRTWALTSCPLLLVVLLVLMSGVVSGLPPLLIPFD